MLGRGLGRAPRTHRQLRGGGKSVVRARTVRGRPGPRVWPATLTNAVFTMEKRRAGGVAAKSQAQTRRALGCGSHSSFREPTLSLPPFRLGRTEEADSKRGPRHSSLLHTSPSGRMLGDLSESPSDHRGHTPPHRHLSLGLLTIGSAVPVNRPPAFPSLSFLTYEMGMIPLCLVWGRMERSLTGKAGPKHRAWHTTNAQESTIPSSGRSPKNNEKGQYPTEGSSTAAICIVGGRGKNYWGPLGWCRPSKNPFPFLNPQRGPVPPLCPLACPLPSAGCGDHPQ